MIKIKLSNTNKFTIIDKKDYELVSRHKWFLKPTYVPNSSPYAVANIKINEKHTTITMHRLIMELSDSKIQVDHINGNGLDNRRKNLRIVSNSQNQRNRQKGWGESKYKGVRIYRTVERRGKKDKFIEKWNTRLGMPGGKKLSLGYYKIHQEKAAVLAYDIGVIRYFDIFKLNFPQYEHLTKKIALDKSIERPQIKHMALDLAHNLGFEV